MRILWVKAGKLLPVDTGGKIRSFNILQQLASSHALTLLTYYVGDRDREYERAMADQFAGAVTMHTPAPETTLRKAAHYALRLPRRAPYAVTRFTAAPVSRLVRDWLATRQFDVAICDFLAPAENFPASSPVPRVLFQHNVESMLWDRRAAGEPHPVKRRFYALEAAKMSRFERRTVRSFDHVIAVSEIDRDAMSSMTAPENISVVPTGVDTTRFVPGTEPSTAGLVLFLGSMDWEPNIDGVEYFCRSIWPRVLHEVPDARFRVVGRQPGPSTQRLASESIEITGTVPSVLGHLQAASVVVVPLRIGGGTRLKIYEAMAAGKAVVSTSIGAEGLDVTPGVDIILADEPERFAAEIVRLLRERDQRESLERRALALARRFDWANVSRRFERALETVVSGVSRSEGSTTRETPAAPPG